MQKKTILIAAVFVIAIFSVAAWWWHENQPDDLSRINQPIGEVTGSVEPVLELVAAGLGQLWGIEFMPGSTQLLATENSGRLFLIDTEKLDVAEIGGVPEVDDSGQGGLLDIAISPEFDEDRTIYLTYSAAGEGGTSTHLAKADLDIASLQLSDVEVLYAAQPFMSGASHYGSRVVVDGRYLYVTIGDRSDKNFDDHVSQDTGNSLGTTVRLLRDGSIPRDNPFVENLDVLDEIYSYGHRNAQGMTIQPETGQLWQSEHGERDGDEINIIEAGGNYGWPETHTGCSYVTGRDIGDLPWERDDIVDPVHFWECNSGGFPPAGMTFYNAEGFSDWQGDLFVGGLAGEYLAHFRLNDDGLEELEPLLEQEGWRVRDVTVGQHDGAIYAAVEGRDTSLARIVPKPINR